MEQHNFRKFIIFWLSQSVSQLGSAMTSFALVIWAYTQTKSAMAVSLMTFCSYLPYILVSVAAGGFVDRHRKKTLILIVDLLAAVCSLAVLVLWYTKRLEIYHIYVVNTVIGLMNSIQSPAESVAIGLLAPKEKMTQVSGMDSFSSNLITVTAPVLAASLVAFGGLGVVIAVDLMSFIFAFTILLFFIPIPEVIRNVEIHRVFDGFREGLSFLKKHSGVWDIMMTMAGLNFLSMLAYENILTPMILSRSGYDANMLGFVNAVLGGGGILGGIVVSFSKKKKNPVHMMYVSAGISFLIGDLLMGVGHGAVIWSIAALGASVPIPFLSAGQRVILYEMVPTDMQGRVFSVRNVFQYGTIPLGLLLGGVLADYVFEPFMASGTAAAGFLGRIVGTGAGSGMAVMFLCTGIFGSLACLAAWRRKGIRDLEQYFKTRE